MRNLIKNAVSLVGTHALPLKRAGVILMYHSVGDNQIDFTVSEKMFEKQMRYLRDHKFDVVSLDTMIMLWEKDDIPPKTVSITFDDGYLDNYTCAYPILTKYGFSATIFVTTGLIDRLHSVRGVDFHIMNDTHLCELDTSGFVQIEPHSVTHPKLKHCSRDEIWYELTESKRYLETLLKKECRYFAYPYGAYSPEVLELAQEAGYKAAFGVVSSVVDSSSQRYHLPRNGVSKDMSLAQFAMIVRHGRVWSKK